jgi:hypothetical protein
MTQQVMFDREAIAENIIKFAQDNKLRIHPGQDPLKWGDLLIKRGGHCPCVPGRNHCPCEFVLEDIKELGRCRCGLFCNDAFVKLYDDLNAKRKSRKKWTRKPKGNF